MGKARYLAGRIRQLDYKNMIRIAKAVSKKEGKAFPTIFVDMVKCGFTYQAGYYDYQEFEFANLSAASRATYLTRGLNNAIVKKYNDINFFPKFNDKAIFNHLFEPYLKRAWCDLRETDEEAFAEFFKAHPKVIAKPVDGEGGAGIDCIDGGNPSDVYHSMLEKGQMLVEEFVVQHDEMNTLAPGSVNTLRMFTFYHDGHGTFLQAILKMGNGAAVDNFSAGGMYTFVEPDGKVITPAVDKADNVYKEHPMTKTPIIGFTVPFFKEAIQMVEDAACVVPEVAYVGWDVAITPTGPVIIEGNCFPGVFQKRASFSPNKQGVLPLYRAAGIEV